MIRQSRGLRTKSTQAAKQSVRCSRSVPAYLR